MPLVERRDGRERQCRRNAAESLPIGNNGPTVSTQNKCQITTTSYLHYDDWATD
jgi:hypothetical protein